MKRSFVVTATFVLVSISIHSASAGDGADLTAYIESIRASGMSEAAQMQVGSIASVVAGATILTYQVDPESGRYWPGYMSTTCPNPNADPPELTRWKSLKTDESAVVLEQLKPFADADGSGFVTSQEGSDFRWLLEFGYLAAQTIRDEEATVQAIARASGKDVAATEASLREFAALSERITAAGVAGLPEVVVPGTKSGGGTK
jgi:hypothetical protein